MSKAKMKCPDCRKVCKGNLGLAMHMKRSHQTSIERVNNVQPQIDPNLPHVTYVAGYVQASIDHYARGHDLSAGAITRGVGRHLYGAAGR